MSQPVGQKKKRHSTSDVKRIVLGVVCDEADLVDADREKVSGDTILIDADRDPCILDFEHLDVTGIMMNIEDELDMELRGIESSISESTTVDDITSVICDRLESEGRLG